MSLVYKFKGRVVRLLLKVLPIQLPVLFKGAGSTKLLIEQVSVLGYKKALIVTDEVLHKLGAIDGIKTDLERLGVEYAIYDGVLPNPEFAQVTEGLSLFKKEKCDCIISVGGGSVIDAGKMVAMLHNNPGPLKQFDGIQKFKKAGTVQFVVPSTAGTGSEVTIAAVISEAETHSKVSVVDTKMVPQFVALDSEIMKGMPPSITAATGMDALTHAVESYINKGQNENADSLSKTSTQLIFKFLQRAFDNGEDLEARDGMALASFYAGLAFSRKSLGYVHGIAHQLGAICNTPHGMANAMVLPEVLSAYGGCVHEKLAVLACECGIGSPEASDAQNAADFIQAIIDLRKALDLPLKPKGFKPELVDDVVARALNESGNLHPVPRYMSRSEVQAIVQKLL